MARINVSALADAPARFVLVFLFRSSFRFILHSLLTAGESTERFSRKVFVGGLPPDIDEEEIKASFRRFGALAVDWPHKAESKVCRMMNLYEPCMGYELIINNCKIVRILNANLHCSSQSYFPPKGYAFLLFQDEASVQALVSIFSFTSYFTSYSKDFERFREKCARILIIIAFSFAFLFASTDRSVHSRRR